MTPDLYALLKQLQEQFPSANPLNLEPTAGTEAWGSDALRFSGGPARRWFAATNGQSDSSPAVYSYTFCPLDEALVAVETTDALRAEPEGYWVEPHWIAIAHDGAGQYIMIDDLDGRVLMVAHDDDEVDVLAESPESWLQELIGGCASGTLVWDAVFGLTDADELAEVHRYQTAHRKVNADRALSPADKVKVGLVFTGCGAACALLIWWFES